MSSVGIRCGGSCFLNSRSLERNIKQNACIGLGNNRINFSPNNAIDLSRCKRARVVMAIAMMKGGDLVQVADSKEGGRRKAVVYDKVDEWMRDSVGEIVKNLKEAPLLVHVYSDENGGKTELKTETAVTEEDWPVVKEKWEKKETQMPEGVIFVERLEEEGDGGDDDVDDERARGEALTRAWGVLVQGRGSDCGPVCYLLKTSRVGSGLGLWCTHFCLMRVSNFRETARSQLKNCWLVQGK